MSYDTSIIIDTGGEYPAEVEEVGNYTSNVSFMYALALPNKVFEGGCHSGYGEPNPRTGLPGLSGLKCKLAELLLNEAIDYMIGNEEELTKLEPANGWGSYRGAVKYLRDCINACNRHPKAIFAVSW